MNIKLVILFWITTVCAVNLPGIAFQSDLSRGQNVHCGSVKHDANGRYTPQVKATLKKTSAENGQVPVFILHYVDILKLDRLPAAFSFYNDGLGYDGTVDFKQNKFNVKEKSGETVNYLNSGFTEAGQTLSLDVKETGYYCVYVAPQAENLEYKVDVEFVSSHGTVSFQGAIKHSQVGTYLLIGIPLAIFLVYYTSSRFKSSSLGLVSLGVSMTTKATIYGVLAPLLMIALVRYLTFFTVSKSSFTGNWHEQLFKWLEQCFIITMHYFTLLFAMGYTVIYSRVNNRKTRGYSTSSTYYRKIPSRLWNRALLLYVANIVVYSAITLFKLVENIIMESIFTLHNQTQSGYELVDALRTGKNFLTFVNGCFPLLWFLQTTFSYFATKRTINKFPKFSTLPLLSLGATSGISGSFRWSSIVILVLPLIYGIFSTAAMFVQAYKMSKLDGASAQPPASEDDWVKFQVMSIVQSEKVYFDSTPLLVSSWMTDLYILLTVIGIFFIWMRKNVGVVQVEEEEILMEDQE